MYVITIRIEDSLNLYFTLDVNRQILLCAKDPNARDASHHITSRLGSWEVDEGTDGDGGARRR